MPGKRGQTNTIVPDAVGCLKCTTHVAKECEDAFALRQESAHDVSLVYMALHDWQESTDRDHNLEEDLAPCDMGCLPGFACTDGSPAVCS